MVGMGQARNWWRGEETNSEHFFIPEALLRVHGIVGMSLGLNVWGNEVSESNCLKLFINESRSWPCGLVLFDITAECIWVY